MKKIILIIATIITISCTSKNKVPSEISKGDASIEKTFIDTLDLLYSDTSNLASSPLIIISTEIGEKNRMLKTPITFTIKNVGNKDIEAAKFRMIVRDAFGENLFEFTDLEPPFRYGEARMDKKIKAGQVVMFEDIIHYLGEPKKVFKAFAYEIAFSDGKIWKASGK